MAGTFTRTDPTPVVVHQTVGAGTLGTASAKQHGQVTVSMTIPAVTAGTASTADVGFVKWVNPEAGTILVTDVIVYFSTTGTGTYDIGISSDGTGSNNNVIDGGTMSALNFAVRAYRGRTGTEGAGTLGMQDVLRLGPGGSGTNNSIVGKTAELTSTAKGMVFITYIPTGT